MRLLFSCHCYNCILSLIIYSYCYAHSRLGLCCRIDECSAGKVILLAVRDYIVIYIVTYMDPQFSTLLPTVKDELARRLTAVGSFVAILRE